MTWVTQPFATSNIGPTEKTVLTITPPPGRVYELGDVFLKVTAKDGTLTLASYYGGTLMHRDTTVNINAGEGRFLGGGFATGSAEVIAALPEIFSKTLRIDAAFTGSGAIEVEASYRDVTDEQAVAPSDGQPWEIISTVTDNIGPTRKNVLMLLVPAGQVYEVKYPLILCIEKPFDYVNITQNFLSLSVEVQYENAWFQIIGDGNLSSIPTAGRGSIISGYQVGMPEIQNGFPQFLDRSMRIQLAFTPGPGKVFTTMPYRRIV